MLILLFFGSQTSVMAFEGMVTSAAALAKGSSNWEGFFYTHQSIAGPVVKLSSIKWVLTDLDSPLPSHDLFTVFLCFPQLHHLSFICKHWISECRVSDSPPTVHKLYPACIHGPWWWWIEHQSLRACRQLQSAPAAAWMPLPEHRELLLGGAGKSWGILPATGRKQPWKSACWTCKVEKREDMGWLKLCLEAVGVVISLGCFLDWILAPLLMWPLVQKRH